MGLDNQQERLAFLAGLIEGEGTITIQTSNKRKNGKHNLLPIVQIANSNVELIEFTVKTLQETGISPFVYWKQRTGKSLAPSATVQISGYKRVVAFLRLITPYLISKRRQAEVVLAMCERRCDLPKNTPYTDADLLSVGEIRRLNTKPGTRLRESSETIRSA